MAKAKDKIEKREAKIIKFLKSFIDENYYAPTVREICDALEIKSTSTVHNDLNRLEEKGVITRHPSKPRAMKLNLEDNSKDSVIKADFHSDDTNIVNVPIVGTVAAGTPILAEENINDYFSLPSQFVSGTNYMLRVQGESMIDVGIFDGDLILVQKQNTARNGEIVVAMIDGIESEATVKTFYKEDGYIRLQPENETMQPIIAQNVTILGKVKGVFRYYS